ncbi:hypothetical protein L3X38_027955 [Prunus dulcis]|uniref:Uncharacterized protein n=1 Tax=Prunus dulcis TaxID=3755 RepID=A0AAD4VQ86_PRUDU|nr:hypothetical protein L3X38_027955 [Prunus dulcis]
MQWKSWRVKPDEIKVEVRGQLSTNYNLEDLDEESLTYVNKLFAERFKQWKSDLHHHFLAFDDPQVALQEGCSKELEGREDSWEWLCAHFQAPEFVEGSKFPEIDVFDDVYVRPENELAESLHLHNNNSSLYGASRSPNKNLCIWPQNTLKELRPWRVLWYSSMDVQHIESFDEKDTSATVKLLLDDRGGADAGSDRTRPKFHFEI